MAALGRAGLATPNRPGRDRAAEAVAMVENALGAAPIVLICEHASNHIPAAYGELGLSEAERASHIAWDPGALGVARELSARLDAPLVYATVSRLVLDLNRDPSAPDSITTLSERTEVPGNRNLGAEDRARRIAEVYRAFHDAVASLIEARRVAGLVRAVVSVHSFTPVYRGVARPWHVGLIFNHDKRLALALEAALRQDRDLVVGMNAPYSPEDRVFHTLERHAERQGLAPLMIEIRNDLIATPDRQKSWSDRIGSPLEEAVERMR